MKYFLILVAANILPLLCIGQKFTLGDIPLQWDDFSIIETPNDVKNSSLTAFIYTNIPYEWEVVYGEFDTSISFVSHVVIDRNNSWVRKAFLQSAPPGKKIELLNHEKGHVILALIQQKRLQKLLLEYNFSRKPKREINRLYNELHLAFIKLNEKYDEETQHMANQEKQKEWIERLLDELNILYEGAEYLDFRCETKILMK